MQLHQMERQLPAEAPQPFYILVVHEVMEISRSMNESSCQDDVVP